MNYEGFDGHDFHNREDSDDSGLIRVAKLQEGVVPIISRAECGDAKVRIGDVLTFKVIQKHVILA